MGKSSQMLKGLLEGCILKIIQEKETYGYELVEDLKQGGFTEVTEGSVYPIVLRLEKKGIISSIKKASPLGPKRKYYFLTDLGRKELTQFLEGWVILKQNVDYFIEDFSKKEVSDENR